MTPRPSTRLRVRRALERADVVLLTGPKQCGKTTLARAFAAPGAPTYFDLEDPVDLARLAEPMTTLAGLRGTIVLDEIQYVRGSGLLHHLLGARTEADLLRHPKQGARLTSGRRTRALNSTCCCSQRHAVRCRDQTGRCEDDDPIDAGLTWRGERA
jgi:hypothetical protein